MFVEELFLELTTIIAECTGVPILIPLIGDWREIVVRWARDNPEAANELAEEIYSLLKRYKKREE